MSGSLKRDPWRAPLLALVVAIVAAGFVPSQASKLKVVTSTSDLGALATEVGGDRAWGQQQ